MAFPVSTRPPLHVLESSQWNADVAENLNELRSGGISIASQANNDVIVANGASQLSRVPTTADRIFTTDGSGAPGWRDALPAANASALHGINATSISVGTISNSRLPSGISVGTLALSGAATITGNVSCDRITANGRFLTSINATSIDNGTLSNSRLPASISVTNLAGNGHSITTMNAANIGSGTLNNSRLPSAISVTSLTLSGNAAIGGNVTANVISANGSGLTSLNADEISSGTISTSRLPAEVSVGSLVLSGTAAITGNLSCDRITANGRFLSSLNASAMNAGTLNNSRLPSAISVGTLELSGAATIAGNVTTTGNVTANIYSGNGVSLTSLNASAIATGTVSNSRLPSAISVGTLALSGAATITGNVTTTGNVTANVITANGVSLTSLNASALATGTVSNSRLPSAISVASLTLSGDATVTANVTAARVIANGAFLTTTNASALATGTVSNSRLPSAISVGTLALTGAATIGGNVSADRAIANGALLTSLNASAITDGTINNSRLPASISVTNLAGAGSGITSLNASALATGTVSNSRLPSDISVTTLAGAGSGITSLNASAIASGTISTDRLPATISVGALVLSGDATVSGNVGASHIVANGSALTSLNASEISSGTLSNSRLPASISVSSLSGNGHSITTMNAANIGSGTLNNARLPSAISVASLTLSGDATVTANVTAARVIANGAFLTTTNASALSSGTISNSRLPASISVTTLAGAGSGITSLNASAIATGTIDNARLPSAISVGTLALSGAATITGNVTADRAIANGALLTSLNASAVSAGTINNARLPSSISVGSLTLSGTATITGNVSCDRITANGALLTSLNATAVSAGTLNNARLPATIEQTTIRATQSLRVTGTNANLIIMGEQSSPTGAMLNFRGDGTGWQLRFNRSSGNTNLMTLVDNGNLWVNGTINAVSVNCAAVTANVGAATCGFGADSVETMFGSHDQRLTNIESLLSDASAKMDITACPRPASTIDALEWASYTWKDSEVSERGFVAQAVAQSAPHLVVTRPDGLMGISVKALLYEIVAALQDVRERLASLEGD